MQLLSFLIQFLNCFIEDTHNSLNIFSSINHLEVFLEIRDDFSFDISSR